MSRYYLRFSVVDRPGVLAQIAKYLGAHHVSIAEVIQLERRINNTVPLIMVTHHTEEAAIEAAVSKIDRLSCVRARSQKIRIED
jgi:homoserine dehydrogenase